MRVDSLTIKNFLSHKDSTLRLANRGLVLIEGENRDRGGSNAAGKTSCVDGLFWALFGQLIRPLTLKDASHRGKGNMEALVTLTLDDGRKVAIHRVHSHKTIKNPLHVEIDGNTIDGATQAETQKKINSLLRLDAKTFKHVCLFSANDQAFASLTDKGQKEILDSIMGLDRLPKALDRVSEKLKEFKLRRFNLDSKVSDLTKQRERVLTAISKLEESDKGFQNAKTFNIKRAQGEILQLMTQEPVFGERQAIRLKELKARTTFTQDTLTSRKALAEELSELRAVKLRAEMQKHQAEQHWAAVVLIDPDAEVAAQASCPACKQSLPVSALKSLHKTYAKKRKEQEGDLKHYAQQISEATKTLKLAVPKLEELARNATILEKEALERQKVEVELAKLSAQKQAHEREHSTWSRSMDLAKAELKRAQSQESPYQGLIALERQNLERVEESFRKAKAEQEGMDIEQSYLDFWKLGFSNQGVKGLVLDTITPFLNARANHYLGVLSGGAARVEFMTHFRSGDEVKEKFDVEAGYAMGADTYDGTSDGERRRVDIACLFALGDLAAARSGTTLELRMLDEPFGPLDALGHQQVLKLLEKEILPTVGTILLTSHEESIAALIEKRIKIVKERGVSRVEDDL